MDNHEDRANLEIYLLGAPEIYFNGKPLTGLSTKTQALLFYLATTRQTHARTVLATLLWSETAEKNARGNLRKAVQQLRATLPDQLILKEQSVALCTDETIWVDVAAFDEQLAAAEKDDETNAPEGAVDLYRGDFLTGFFVRNAPDFEMWQLTQQGRLREQMITALELLSQQWVTSQEYTRAIAATRRIIELEPWREEAHRQLMELLARSGDRSAALKQFDLLRQVLLDEFDDDAVSTATCQLYNQIRNHENDPFPTSVTSSVDHFSEGHERADGPPTTVTLVGNNFHLPLDAIPPPAPLTRGSIMPLSRNPLFVGRDEDLQALAEALYTKETAAITQVETAATTGLGGIGKTQLACEFVHRYGCFFPGGVFWLSFDNAESIPAEIAACGDVGALDLRPDFGKRSLAEQVRLVQAAWQEPIPRLLIFDNCEELTLLTRWRPTSGGCRIIVTSRRGDWEPTLGVSMVALNVLSRAASLALLRGHCPNAGTVTLEAIAEELGDLPLALHLAGSYLRRHPHVMPDDYLRQLRDPQLLQHPSMQGQGFSPTGHLQHVGRTFALSYDRLDPQDETDARAVQLLVHAAHFAPGEPIWYRLLMKTLDLELDLAEDAAKADAAFARLIELGLIEREANDTLWMHRLVARFVRDVAHEQVKATQKAVEAVVFAETATMNKQVRPLPLLSRQLHLRTVADIAQVREDVESARLCHEVGVHLWQIGDYAGALPYHAKALAIREQLHGEYHPDTAQSLDSMGRLMRALGRNQETRPYLERALTIRVHLFGEMHVETAVSLNNLGRCRHDEEGEPQEALPELDRALAIGKRLLSPNDALLAEFHNDLGRCHKALGRQTDALIHFEQALAINTKMLGPEHPHTALIHNNLGALLYSMERYDEARAHYEQSLAIRRQVYGSTHPDTSQTLNNLGVLLRDLGELQQAKGYLEEALHAYQETVGDDHLHTAIAHKNLAILFTRNGQTTRARTHLEQTLTIRRRLLGPDHLSVQKIEQELTTLLASVQG